MLGPHTCLFGSRVVGSAPAELFVERGDFLYAQGMLKIQISESEKLFHFQLFPQVLSVIKQVIKKESDHTSIDSSLLVVTFAWEFLCFIQQQLKSS